MNISSLAGQVSGQQLGSLESTIGVSLLSDQLDSAEQQANAIDEMLPPPSGKLLDVRA